MKNLRTEQMAGADLAQIGDKERDDTGLSDVPQGTGALRYLKCWGVDYPYLGRARGAEKRWLPLALNSAAQGVIGDGRRH